MHQGLDYDIEAVVPLAVESGLPVSLCTIQDPDGLLVGSGQPSGNWVDVAGLVDLIAMDAPLNDANIRADEDKGELETTARNLRHVWLAGYYPEIQTNMRAVIDSATTYDILGSEYDSQRTQTRLHLLVATI